MLLTNKDGKQIEIKSEFAQQVINDRLGARGFKIRATLNDSTVPDGHVLFKFDGDFFRGVAYALEFDSGYGGIDAVIASAIDLEALADALEDDGWHYIDTSLPEDSE